MFFRAIVQLRLITYLALLFTVLMLLGCGNRSTNPKEANCEHASIVDGDFQYW